MDRAEVLKKVVELVAAYLGVSPEAVTETASFTDDLQADSLDQVELVMAVEEDFDLLIDDVDAEKWKTVGDVVDYIVKAKE